MIETREGLIHVLTEAAEIEHNLLCSYLYATFSLKRKGEAGLTVEQGEAVESWRKAILSVSLEEMAHLACVNNLLLAVGGAAHFDRPNLPVTPGYHPAGLIIKLSPFTAATLDHFIFLERPKGDPIADGSGFRTEHAERMEVPGAVTPSAINYQTVGDLYDGISDALRNLVETIGETRLFPHGGRGQLDAKQTGLPTVSTIENLESALRVVELIKEQGEGSSGAHQDSHFDRFQEIKQEWARLLAADPGFDPAWPAAHNPVMRRPQVATAHIWISEPDAAAYLDCGNAAYGLMLTILQQIYSVENRGLQTALMKLAVAVMELAALFGSRLARLPAGPDHASSNAGLSFAVPRNLGARVGDMVPQLEERLAYLEAAMVAAAMESDKDRIKSAAAKCRSLIPARTALS